MTALQKAVGILGGTFDPIHIGHLRFALEAHDMLALSQVHIVPCFQPVHRTPPKASPEARFSMVKAAVSHEPALYADPREMNLKKPNFMIDTLEAMRSDMPTTPLCLLVGIDTFLEFSTWHRFQDILKVAHLIIGNRPSFHLPTGGPVAELLQAHQQTEFAYLHQHLSGSIILLPITALDISASKIRTQIVMGKNTRYLVSSEVYHYIQQEGIYRS